MALPTDWKARLEKWWKTGRSTFPFCMFCRDSNGQHWEARELAADPPTVALVCPHCDHAEVFLWELLEQGQQV